MGSDTWKAAEGGFACALDLVSSVFADGNMVRCWSDWAESWRRGRVSMVFFSVGAGASDISQLC